ncbi:DNA-3-methyladenine glycosylase 2 family protein [Streptomyces pinistramenti]|uniref:DNA-3-methyladenine glycosylase 2 family protein n=1 Tax=Streptomyces pinistramenti TaxID=2884812 RepID=UPI001D07FBD4|nr:AlkA N-terminal domain-containing protein [Streptomyces pinistramenti]MCB5912110.1 helix-turn-helix domain-containing protein [Streptomyces pinistramenti]
MDDATRYEAVSGRDARFDGEFFFAVTTTGIYCRPSCPALTPKQANVRFYPSAAAAQAGGFRACRRCRPDAVPGSAAWNVRADLVGRAMRFIGDGVVDREGVAGLARRLGYSTRQVQRQLTAELGAGPVALARARRAHTARVLLQTTALPVTELAFAAGFASIRQFNATMREIYAGTPRELRAAAATADTRRATGPAPGGIPLRLAFRGPYAATEIFDYLAAGAVAGVEEIRGPRGRRTYRRTLRLSYGTAVAEADERTRGQRRGEGGRLEGRLRLTDPRDLATAVQRLRRLFDLDADPYAVAERLSTDPLLGPLVAARPGLRSPGAADPEELAVRTVIGGPPERAAELVRAYGKPLDAADGGLTHVFPAAAELVGAAVPEPVRALCAALADGRLVLDAGADRDAAERTLRELPGVGARAAAYIRMRALGDPDAGPDGAAGPWRPWRAYALHHLWAAGHLPAGEWLPPGGPALLTPR